MADGAEGATSSAHAVASPVHAAGSGPEPPPAAGAGGAAAAAAARSGEAQAAEHADGDDAFGEFEGGGSWSDEESARGCGLDGDGEDEAAGYAMLADDGESEDGEPPADGHESEAARESGSVSDAEEPAMDAASVRAVIAVTRAAQQAAALDADYEETVRSAAAAAAAAAPAGGDKPALPSSSTLGATAAAGACSSSAAAAPSDAACASSPPPSSTADFDPFGTERRLAARKEAIRRRRVMNNYTSAAAHAAMPARVAKAAALPPQAGLADQRIGRFSASQRSKIQESMKKLALSPPGVFAEGATNAALDRIVAAAIAKGRKMLDVEAAMLPPEP